MSQQADAEKQRNAGPHRRLFRKLSSRNWEAVTSLSDMSAKIRTSFNQTTVKPPRWGVLGVKHTLADDFTFQALDMDWWKLLLVVLGAYFAVSCIFAALFYYIAVVCKERSHIMGDIPPQMSLAEACLWFSITNLTTVGYGSMVPGSRTANIICTLEHFTGIVMSSLLLGVVVMKASMPTAKIVFSSHALMTQRNGVPHMLVRAGNTRGNFLLNPEIRIAYLRRVVTQEGEVTFLPLKMEFVDPPAMAPCVNIAHQVDEHSPLYGKSAADIKAEEGAVYVSVSATDDNFLQTVYARTVYRFDDIKWNHRFVDVLMQKGGRQCVDFRKFHDLCDLSDPQAQATLRSNSNKAVTPWARLPTAPEHAATDHGGTAGTAGAAGTAGTADVATQREAPSIGQEPGAGDISCASGYNAEELPEARIAGAASLAGRGLGTGTSQQAVAEHSALQSTAQHPNEQRSQPTSQSEAAGGAAPSGGHPRQGSHQNSPAVSVAPCAMTTADNAALPHQPSLVGNGLEASPQKPSSHSPLGSVRKRVGVLFKSRPAMYH